MTKEDQEPTLNNSDEISLKELILKIIGWWHYLLSKWKLIIIAGVVGGTLGFFYAYLKKPIYTAELSFALQDEKSGGGLGSALGLASQFGIDLGGSAGGEFSGDNLLELMQSRSMVEKALLTPVDIKGKTETLAEFYIEFNQLRKAWQNKPELKNIHFFPNAQRPRFSLQQDSILGTFYKSLTGNNLTVDKLDKKLSIINLKVRSKNELFSKYFAEILAKVVSDFYVQTKTKRSIENVNILQRQTDSVRRMLNAAISGVAFSIDAAPNANPSLQTLRVPSQRRQVDVQANTAILTELVKNLEAEKVTLRRETPLIQIIDNPILPLEKEQIGKRTGMIIGCILSVFFTVIILALKIVYKKIMVSA